MTMLTRKVIGSCLGMSRGKMIPSGTLFRCYGGLTEYEVPEWAKHLKGTPTHKVQLAHLNTPIHRWSLTGVPEGFEVYIKRDDMTGSTLSGNKVRKLEFLLADAIRKGCKHVITCGGLQSNHCRATAVAAAHLGLKTHLLLRTDIQSVDEAGCTGNMLLNRLCGAEIYLAPRSAPYETQLKPRMNMLAQKIREETGEEAYLICVGGSDSVGFHGYVSAFQELIDQGIHDGFDDVVFACGSGGTAEGLAIANHLTESKLRIHGVSVSDDAKYFHSHTNNIISSIGVEGVRSEDILNIIDGHKGAGYGISQQEELDFIVDVSIKTGIMLDPVYTGKAVLGLIHQLQNNPNQFKGKRILYIHTGGIFGLYDGRIEDTLINKHKDTNNVFMWKDIEKPPF